MTAHIQLSDGSTFEAEDDEYEIVGTILVHRTTVTFHDGTGGPPIHIKETRRYSPSAWHSVTESERLDS
ncbi:hypothetical protein [Aldersonia kunmingensis]|uniref:hypothetical protein n=1 Tax=Aldersonia kunmingensis TaxID=408066 RepID=UPI0008317C56|nr:hypothetical protein [Aldersonia kunmingensis]